MTGNVNKEYFLIGLFIQNTGKFVLESLLFFPNYESL